MTPEPNPEHRAAVRIPDDHVTLSPHASFMITVYCEESASDDDAILERDQRLLLKRGVSVARGIAHFKQRGQGVGRACGTH